MTEPDQPMPPTRVRTTRLQEAQLPALSVFERQAAAAGAACGLTEEDLATRDDAAIAALTRTHDVIVAEADHETAGYLAWADEAPGVAVLTQVCVGEDFHRFGIATTLLRQLGDKASEHGIDFVVAPVWTNLARALGFLATRGFMPVDQGVVPEPVARWVSQSAAGRLREGQTLMWRTTKDLGHIPGLPKP